MKQIAGRLAQQRDYPGATTIYETLVTEIFEHSHLYYDKEAEYNDYYYEEPYYPEEVGLNELVEVCIEAPGNCLTNERADRVAREKIIDVLFASISMTCMYGYTYNSGYGYYRLGDISLDVTRAAEETRHREAIEMFRQQAERQSPYETAKTTKPPL
ncbi:MAG: hypothetical protein ACYDER_18240 [Ktedonobacteraceae bacterium]